MATGQAEIQSVQTTRNGEIVTWSIGGMDRRLYRRTSLLSAQYVATQRYTCKRMRLSNQYCCCGQKDVVGEVCKEGSYDCKGGETSTMG